MHPAQNYGTNIGKIVRIFDDGGIPETNPYFNRPPPTNKFGVRVIAIHWALHLTPQVPCGVSRWGQQMGMS